MDSNYLVHILQYDIPWLKVMSRRDDLTYIEGRVKNGSVDYVTYITISYDNSIIFYINGVLRRHFFKIEKTSEIEYIMDLFEKNNLLKENSILDITFHDDKFKIFYHDDNVIKIIHNNSRASIYKDYNPDLYEKFIELIRLNENLNLIE